MLPHSLKLSRRGFEEAKGLRRSSSAHFSLSYGNVSEHGGSAVIVSKKVVAGAVARHLLKRRVRAVLRPWSAKTHVLIVSAKRGTETLSFAEIKNELSILLTSANSVLH